MVAVPDVTEMQLRNETLLPSGHQRKSERQEEGRRGTRNLGRDELADASRAFHEASALPERSLTHTLSGLSVLEVPARSVDSSIRKR